MLVKEDTVQDTAERKQSKRRQQQEIRTETVANTRTETRIWIDIRIETLLFCRCENGDTKKWGLIQMKIVKQGQHVLIELAH